MGSIRICNKTRICFYREVSNLGIRVRSYFIYSQVCGAALCLFTPFCLLQCLRRILSDLNEAFVHHSAELTRLVDVDSVGLSHRWKHVLHNEYHFINTATGHCFLIRAIQVLRNAVWVSDFPEKSTTKMYGSTLLALRGGGCQICRKKHYVTIEWPYTITETYQFYGFRRWGGINSLGTGNTYIVVSAPSQNGNVLKKRKTEDTLGEGCG